MTEKTPGDVDMTGEDSEPEIVSSSPIEEVAPSDHEEGGGNELHISDPVSEDIAEASEDVHDASEDIAEVSDGSDDSEEAYEVSEHSDNSEVVEEEEQDTSDDEESETEMYEDDADETSNQAEDIEYSKIARRKEQSEGEEEEEMTQDSEDEELVGESKKSTEDDKSEIPESQEKVESSASVEIPEGQDEIPEFVSLNDALTGAEQDLELLPQQTRDRLTALWLQHSMTIKQLKSMKQQNEVLGQKSGDKSEDNGPYVLDVISGAGVVEVKTAEMIKEQEAMEEQSMETLIEALHRKRTELSLSGRERDEMRMQAEELERQLQRREQELQRVLAENTTLSSQLSSAINAKCEALVQSQNVASKEAQLQHRERCMEQQLELLHSQIRQMTEQIKDQAEELAEVRQSTSTRILKLENDLQIKTEQLRVSEESTSRLQDNLCEEQRRVEALQDKLRDARDSEIALQETHNQQLQTQVRLAHLCQEESQQAHAVNEKYTGLLQELQAALREASDKFGELETTSEMEKAKLNAELENHKQVITALKQELKSANLLLEQSNDVALEQQVALISPAAAVARKLAQSGLTLTQIYSQYVATSEELEHAKSECEQLRLNMDNIIKQLEERAPQFAADRETLRRIQQENVRLLTEHDAMLHQCEEVKNEAHQERRRACKLDRDNQRMQEQINDLSKQIIVLLREVESLKHCSLPSSLNRSHSYDELVNNSPGEMLTRRLVPFRDVDELQKRNLELLAVVRELSSKAVAEEQAEAAGQDMSMLSARLDEAVLELKEVQEREKQHARLMEHLIQQRNNYRDAMQGGPGVSTQEVALSPMKLDPSSPLKRSVSHQVSEDIETKNKLKIAEEKLADVKRQLEQQQRSADAKYLSLEKEVDLLRAKSAEDKIARSKLAALSEHKEQKLASAQAKVQNITKQLEAETKKCKAKSDAAEKYMTMASELQKQANAYHSQLRQTQVALSSVESELERLRYVESSLQQECASLQRTINESSNVQTSIEEMRAVLERTSAESNAILIRQLEEANLESRGLRKQLQEEQVRLGEELSQLQCALNNERTAVEQAKAETAQAHAEVAKAAERHAQTERDIQAMRAHRNPSVDTASQTEVCVSEEVLREKRNAQQVAELEQQRSVLQSELALSQAKVTELTSIVEATETALRHVRDATEQANKEAAQSLEDAHQQIDQMHARVHELESQLSKMQEEVCDVNRRATEKIAETDELKLRVDKLSEHYQETQEKCQALQSALEAAEAEARATTDRLTLEVEQHKEHKLAHEQLQQQLLAEVEASKALRGELEDSRRQLTEMESKVLEREAALEAAGSEKKQQLEELQAQNTALLDQVQLMGAELCALKQTSQSQVDVAASTSSLNLSSSFSEDSASPEQLLQVLRYLRTEKSAALAKNETLTVQNAELKAKLHTLEEQLQRTLAQSSSLDPSAPEVVTRARYDELLRRLEVLNALSESSTRQREACTTLRKENSELQARVSALSSQLETITAEATKANEKVETLQGELTGVRGEANRWRTCANQLTERANRANPEEQKRLLQERENLQRQLASEREEIRKTKQIVTEREAELERVRGELLTLQGQFKVKQDDYNVMSQNFQQKEQAYCDLVNKELQVRRIAKKYKMQYEDLLKTAEEKQKQEAVGAAGAQELAAAKQQLEVRVGELEAKAETLEKERSEAQSNLVAEQAKAFNLMQKLEAKDKEVDNMQKEAAAHNEKAERAKQVLNTARVKISRCTEEINALKQEITTLTQANAELTQAKTEAQLAVQETQTKLQALEQNKEEDNVRKAALATQYEGNVSRLKRELAERLTEIEQLKQQKQQQQVAQAQQQARPPKQVIKVASSVVEKTSVEPPTANIRPMAGPSSQAKPQQGAQSAAVTPTSRAAPMARLRPMSMASPRSVAVLAPSQQQQQASSSMGGTMVQPEPSTSSAPPQGTSTSSQQGTQGAEVSAAATVVLVRPQEVQPAVSSSQSLQSTSVSAPSTSQQPPSATSHPPPTLKRPRDTDATQQEPRSKQLRSEVSSGSVNEPAEEPSSSLHSAPDEVIIVDSGDDTEGEEEEVDEGMEDEEEEEEGEEYPVEDEEEEECFDEEAEPQDLEEEQEVDDDEEQGFEPEPEQASHVEQDDNEVIILEEPPELPQGLAALLEGGEPAAPEPSSSSAPVPIPIPQARLLLPQQQGYEEVGDDGIVPSTPTLFVPRRREGFGEGVSSPQVPQAQGRLFTFAPESSHPTPTQGEVAEEEAPLEQLEGNGSGRSVPSTPLHVSPQEVVSGEVEVTESEEVLVEAEEVASSSVPAILVTPAGEDPPQQESAEIVEEGSPQLESAEMESDVLANNTRMTPRGGNRARRSGARAAATRPSGRPTPIVWDDSESQPQLQQSQGLGRGQAEAARGVHRGARRGRARPGFQNFMRF